MTEFAHHLPVYARICCTEKCVHNEIRVAGNQGRVCWFGTRVNYPDRTVRFYIASELNRNPDKLCGLKLAGYSLCDHAAINDRVQDMFKSRVCNG